MIQNESTAHTTEGPIMNPTTTTPNSNTDSDSNSNSAVTTSAAISHYKAPGAITRKIVNPFVGWLVKRGVTAKGAAVLSVRGRTSGEWRATPVNPLTFGGERFLVAPRGETHWVRNLRAAGSGRIQRGKQVEEFAAVELEDAAKPAVLRAYLKEWAWEVGAFFDGVGADSTDEQLAAIAPKHPIFRITAG
jgi:deazaflavin-dependent oxidoreductase (nitroreductase family)